MSTQNWMRGAVLLVVLSGVAACAKDSGSSADAALANLSGTITADGSSTVGPITEAMAEEFGRATAGNVRVTVGSSGTGGGFKRFCAGETDISDASRPIKDAEAQLCAQNGVEYIQQPVAIDGLAVVVNPQNTAVQCLTVPELKKIWEPGSTVKNWSEVRAGLPNEEIKLYGPGTNSGTFDYFTEAVVGKEDASRGDYSASEDDNVLVQGVAGDRGALGYFGFAYFQENASRVRAVPVAGGAGCVEPSPEAVASGQYRPLSRPLYLYIKKAALARPEVSAFLRFFIEHAPELVPQVGYVPRPAADYQADLQQLAQPGDTVR
ncbi:MAG: PstS family phosphate ABC transporter substrate-binding protein [Gemmatimonadetes bacterium]|nr:PstS family phosphate ABC transporter substrate-binding protein [Gemmatimonadota bacterium]